MRWEHLRAMIWPRQNSRGAKTPQKIYRYAIIGMLVTDSPIESLDGLNEIVVDGSSFGLSDLLDVMRKKRPNRNMGEAGDVLVSLGSIVD